MKKTLIFNKPTEIYSKGDIVQLDGDTYQVTGIDNISVRGTTIGTSVDIETIVPKSVSATDISTIIDGGIQ